MKRIAGHYLQSTTSPEPFSAFVPFPLPPEPPLDISPDIQQLLEQANLRPSSAFGRVDRLK